MRKEVRARLIPRRSLTLAGKVPGCHCVAARVVEHRVVARKKSRGDVGADTGLDETAGRGGSWCAAHNIKEVHDTED